MRGRISNSQTGAYKVYLSHYTSGNLLSNPPFLQAVLSAWAEGVEAVECCAAEAVLGDMSSKITLQTGWQLQCVVAFPILKQERIKFTSEKLHYTSGNLLSNPPFLQAVLSAWAEGVYVVECFAAQADLGDMSGQITLKQDGIYNM